MTSDALGLEELVHLEQTCYDAGYADGFTHGRIHGLIDGRALGRQKGFDIWEEIGFYQGFASTWDAICAQRRGDGDDNDDGPSRRTFHHVHHLLDLIRQFPTVNSSAAPHSEEMDMERLQRQIRSRYKAFCASLGVRPSLRAGVGGASEDAGQPTGSQNPIAKRDVWMVESNATGQGLSF